MVVTSSNRREYLVLPLRQGEQAARDHLGRLGAEGWEVVATTLGVAENVWPVAVLKRPLD